MWQQSGFLKGAVMLIAVFLASCVNNDSKKKDVPGIPIESAIDLDPRLKMADSLVIVFYKDPYGEDSLRYTRYYTQFSETGNEAIGLLQKQLTTALSKEEKRRKCRGEGKIWCFTKGKIFQTLYFSTSCDNDCCYMFLIKDGNFYYCRIQESLTNWLSSIKQRATEPLNEAGDINE